MIIIINRISYVLLSVSHSSTECIIIIEQDQETWLRRTQIEIPLSPYKFPDILIHFH